MQNIEKKIRLIFLPFLFITIANVVVYTFLRWLLFIKNTAFNVDEDILDFWVPIVLPWIPILIWLRPRIKLLNLKNKSSKGDPLGGYLFVAWIIMSIPILVMQSYIVTATGKLTKLSIINDINKQPLTKYYTLTRFYIDKHGARPKAVFGVSGKHSENFDMTIYMPCPIFDRADTADHDSPPVANNDTSFRNKGPLVIINGGRASLKELRSINPSEVQSVNVLKGKVAQNIYGDAGKNGVILVMTKDMVRVGDSATRKPIVITGPYVLAEPLAWLAVKYQETISNNLSADGKEAAYNHFRDRSKKDFDKKSLNDFVYLDRLSYSSDFRNYTAAITSKKYDSHDAPLIILSPVKESFEARNGNKLAWILGSIGGGSVVFLITLLFKPLRNDALETDISEERTKAGKETRLWIRSLFSASSNLKATRILI